PTAVVPGKTATAACDDRAAREKIQAAKSSKASMRSRMPDRAVGTERDVETAAVDRAMQGIFAPKEPKGQKELMDARRIDWICSGTQVLFEVI
ncbi:MAG TPA: hypothetical protein VGG59_13150, partial [Acidobacteriaceae bacterium]